MPSHHVITRVNGSIHSAVLYTYNERAVADSQRRLRRPKNDVHVLLFRDVKQKKKIHRRRTYGSGEFFGWLREVHFLGHAGRMASANSVHSNDAPADVRENLPLAWVDQSRNVLCRLFQHFVLG